MTVDKFGNLFLTGSTSSDDGISTPGSYQVARFNSSFPDAFLAKFEQQWHKAMGHLLRWRNFMIRANNCTTDGTGNVYIVGITQSLTNIASPGAHQVTYGEGLGDCFMVKFTTGGQRLWATYYGGSQYDNAFGCSTDNSRNVYIAGTTYSGSGFEEIATPGSHQPLKGGAGECFIAKFDSLGVRQWGTYYGGINAELHTVAHPGRTMTST